MIPIYLCTYGVIILDLFVVTCLVVGTHVDDDYYDADVGNFFPISVSLLSNLA